MEIAGEHERRGNEAPCDHDAGNPDARPDPLQDHIARHFEDEVADEEDARAEPVYRIAVLEVARHLQLGESHIDAIQEGNDVTQKQERNQTRGGLLVRGLLELQRGGCRHDWLLLRSIVVVALPQAGSCITNAGRGSCDRYFFGFTSSSRSVAGGGVRESAAISARSSDVMTIFTESSEACS